MGVDALVGPYGNAAGSGGTRRITGQLGRNPTKSEKASLDRVTAEKTSLVGGQRLGVLTT